ncbi:HlyC/CorC family transporter [Candidatus Profftella armatura (Diaphorina cf. continua)]|uniref:HlyC/CorC family transporter n=1 Tax=Candidatus Profftella armatura (Diaphorina cf. continua) TaxID=2661583 RepID=A0A7R6W015_9PROT|nr:hemolysin family protein [Candidatus Profftella armatura (Diaphorina cf. continua)]BCG49603.1 HlyC/CorC family transporter [Candidatus Profftella armatura (Diaphorina cf. continua)]
MNIIIIIGLIFLNGIFSMSEIAIITSKRVRLKKLIEKGSIGALSALILSENPIHFFSTIQIGITLISIFNGAFGEASLVASLTPKIEFFSLMRPYAHEISLIIVVFSITFFSLIFGELIPKRIAMQYSEKVASIISPLMLFLLKLMGPFVKILTISTESILDILNIKYKKNDLITEEEISKLFREGVDIGIFNKIEYNIASRALKLDDQCVIALMTPRMKVNFIDIDDDIEKNLIKIFNSSYNYFPVYKKSISQIIGTLNTKTLFKKIIFNRSIINIDIASAVQPPLFIPETISIMQLLETLKKNKSELSLVIDEYGEIEGIITINDIIHSLIEDISDNIYQEEIEFCEDGSWIINASMTFDRFQELLSTQVNFPIKNSRNYHTLAGFVMTFLGHIPRISENFTWKNLKIEVIDMNNNRIERLLITILKNKK